MFRTFSTFVLAAGLLSIVGCRNNEESLNRNSLRNQQEINQLKIRLKKLEVDTQQIIDFNRKKLSVSSKSPIKSITFRIGTKDDRLRIYWSDGSKTDFPCTKEQSIWACG